METEEDRVRKEDRVTTAMEEVVANRDPEDAITVMEETISAEMSVRTGMQLQSSSSRRAREIRRKIKREIIRRKNTEMKLSKEKEEKARSRNRQWK